MPELGDNFCTALDNLEELIKKTRVSPELDMLQHQYHQLWSMNEKLIDSNVQQATTEYSAAIEVLANANKEIQDAITGLSTVTNVINKIARAITIIDQLLAKVAGL
jgi:hypothetical protein